MITLVEDNINLDLRELSHAKSLFDLWEDESEAFKYGVYYPRVITYLQNANIKKKNPKLYTEINNINKETIDYIEPMAKLIDDFVETGDESLLGVVNYILDNLTYTKDDDRIKMAFVLGVYAISGELARIVKDKLDLKLTNKEHGA